MIGLLMLVAGFAALVYGLWLMWPALSWVVGGVLAMAAGAAVDDGLPARRGTR